MQAKTTLKLDNVSTRVKQPVVQWLPNPTNETIY